MCGQTRIPHNQVDIIWIPKKYGKPCNNPRILALVKEFKDIFEENQEALPAFRELSYKIKLKDSLPKALPLYCLALKDYKALQKQLKEAIKTGLICSSNAL